MSKTQHVTDDLPAYELGALDPEDVNRVESHLKTCNSCRQEWIAYAETAGLFVHALQPRLPAPELKTKILSQAKKSEPTSVQSVPDFWAKFTRRNIKLLFAWSIASLVLLIVLGAGSILNQQNQLQNDTFHTVALHGDASIDSASALIVVPKDDVVGTLVVNRLPQLVGEMEYQLWLIKGEEQISAKVFSVDEDGYDSIYLHLPDLLDTYDSFGITVEPGGGSDMPSGEWVLQGSF